ncbi:MAG: nucleotidyltransferase family protein [Microcoleaceae cyanobacterium]
MNEYTFIPQQLKTQRQTILQIARTYGAYNLRIFGSVARGDNNLSSDLDLLVDLERGRSLFDLGGLTMDLQDLLGCEVDVVTENGLKKRIRSRVLQEAIKL